MERLAQLALVILATYVVYQMAAWVAPVMAPVLLSLLIAYFLDPLVDRFEERRINRTLAIVFIATSALAALVVVGAIVVPVVASEAQHALTQLPAWTMDQYASLRAFAAERFGIDLQESLTGAAALESISTRVQAAVGAIAGSAVDSVASLLNVILIPVFTFYFLRDFDTLKLRPLELVPPRYHEPIVESAKEMDSIVGAWLRGQMQVALFLAILYAVGLGLIGVQLGIFIGILAGLLNVVPYFGIFVGIALSVLMVLINGDPSQLIGVVILFGAAQLLEDYVIKPRLVGEKVGMGPMMVMIVLLMGGSLFGFFGLLLSIPTVAAGSVLVQQLVRKYKKSDFYGRVQDDTDPVSEFISDAVEALVDLVDGADGLKTGARSASDTNDDHTNDDHTNDDHTNDDHTNDDHTNDDHTNDDDSEGERD
ncbi:MAG: putative PurR-regulated permease PerM [Bradymonadia bacterium]